MPAFTKWFRSRTTAERRALWVAALFSVFLVGAVVFCHERNNGAIAGFSELEAIPARTCSDSEECKVILLKGQITPNSINVFGAISELKRKGYQTVCFDSPGGENTVAVALSLFIRENKFDTCMASRYFLSDGQIIQGQAICNSACPWVLLGGINRIAMDGRVSVGFHASSKYTKFCGCEIYSTESQDEKTTYSTLIKKLGNDSRHMKLLDLSFAFGAGPTREIDAARLSADYAFFTGVRGVR